jgi:hypothetical protein
MQINTYNYPDEVLNLGLKPVTVEALKTVVTLGLILLTGYVFYIAL